MKKSFKYRILKYIVLVFIVTSILSTLSAYVYFNQVVQKQIIQNEEEKLNQLVYQLEFMMSDISNFSKSIVIHPLIQENMQQEIYESEFEKAKIRYEMAEQLVFYKSLHNDIGVITLRSHEGRYYSSLSTVDPIYYKTKFEIPELNRYVKKEERILSQPFKAFERDISGNVVSYKTIIRDVKTPDKVIGELYVDIYLDYFLNPIKAYATENKSVFLKDNLGRIIYQEGIEEYKKGLTITRPIENMQWEVGVVVSHDYIGQQSKFVLHFFLIFFMMTIFMVIFLVAWVLDTAVRPIIHLTKEMETIDYNTLKVNFDIHSNDEIELLSIRFKEMLAKINQYNQEALEKEHIQKEMEFDVLMSQINPHYLYNVLNTVVYLSAAKRNEDVVTVVNALIYSLQETLKVGEKNIFTTLGMELDLVKAYLSIQKIRYPNVFEFQMVYTKCLNNVVIPKTIIQPIIENSIIHGIIPLERQGEIRLEIREYNGILEISVEDNGVGISTTDLYAMKHADERDHIGLLNVHQRIQYLYGEKFGLKISKREKGTRIIIKFPLESP